MDESARVSADRCQNDVSENMRRVRKYVGERRTKVDVWGQFHQ